MVFDNCAVLSQVSLVLNHESADGGIYEEKAFVTIFRDDEVAEVRWFLGGRHPSESVFTARQSGSHGSSLGLRPQVQQ